jgi:NADH:ubiquinone oxidoreductase subunit C
VLPEALAELVREAGGDALLLDSRRSRALVADPARLVDICRNIRHHGFTRFIDFTGEHLGTDSFTLRLVLRNPAHEHALLALKWKFTQTAEQPAHPTLSKVWPAAGIAEREIFEMLGVPFAGNENLKPLLLEEQFAGNPLRKDFDMLRPSAYAQELLRQRHERGMVEALHAVGRTAVSASNAADVATRTTEDESRTGPSAPREDDGGQGRPPHQDQGHPSSPEAAP